MSGNFFHAIVWHIAGSHLVPGSGWDVEHIHADAITTYHFQAGKMIQDFCGDRRVLHEQGIRILALLDDVAGCLAVQAQERSADRLHFRAFEFNIGE
jgi:hypothetical protein